MSTTKDEVVRGKIFSDSYTSSGEGFLRSYVLGFIRNSDEGSEFDVRTRGIRHLSDDQLLDVMTSKGYDMILGINGEGILGHLAYQTGELRGLPCWNVFSVAKNPNYPGDVNGAMLGVRLGKDLIQIARKKGVPFLRVGKGNHRQTVMMLKRLFRERETQRVSVDLANNSVEIFD
ncbi:MAG: hypothetical protein KKF56_02790 [Nanoarchaeota archaeon]|nr:hypothetical protein [Nanoarchaeota archaeon]